MIRPHLFRWAVLIALAACGRSEFYPPSPPGSLGPASGGRSASSVTGGASASATGRATTSGFGSTGAQSASTGASGLTVSTSTTAGSASESSGGASSSAASSAAGSSSATGSSGASGTTLGQSTGSSSGSSTTSGSSGSGTAGATSTGTSSGTGASSGGTTGEGCDPSTAPAELQGCTVARDCGCPLLCVTDPFVGSVCEDPCRLTADCPNLLTICNGTSCQLNSCGTGTANGTFNSFCSAVSPNDGTCVPLQIDGGTFGLCLQGGQASAACSASAERGDLSQVCQAGSVCVGGGIGSGGFCGLACDPSGPNTCPPSQGCAITVDDPAAGACVPL